MFKSMGVTKAFLVSRWTKPVQKLGHKLHCEILLEIRYIFDGSIWLRFESPNFKREHTITVTNISHAVAPDSSIVCVALSKLSNCVLIAQDSWA